MKSFIGALVLFLLVTGFVIGNMVCICSTLDEMIALGEELPETADAPDFSKPETAQKVAALYEKWDESVELLTVTVGYDTIDRADEAIVECYQSFRNGEKEEFTVALAKALDALSRMRRLESFHWHSFF